MAEIHLITGGTRSGKSAFAQKSAEALPGPRLYIATCPVIDEELAERVRKHRVARADAGWETVEAPVEIARALREADGSRVILVDCLTLWVNNLLYEAQQRGERFTEALMAARCRELLEACAAVPGTILFVTNEVGMGIVPDNAEARLFRDCAGCCNQAIAAAAREVTLVVSGLPLSLKAPGPPAGPAQAAAKPGR